LNKTSLKGNFGRQKARMKITDTVGHLRMRTLVFILDMGWCDVLQYAQESDDIDEIVDGMVQMATDLRSFDNPSDVIRTLADAMTGKTAYE